MKQSLIEELDQVIKSVKGQEKPGHKYVSRKPKPGGKFEYKYSEGDAKRVKLLKHRDSVVRMVAKRGSVSVDDIATDLASDPEFAEDFDGDIGWDEVKDYLREINANKAVLKLVGDRVTLA